MPFNWNLSRIRNVNIFVQEEISNPKSSNFASTTYSGLIKQLMLDNSSPKAIIHFMLPKDKLVSLAEHMANSSQAFSKLMTFKLEPTIGTITNMTSTGGMS